MESRFAHSSQLTDEREYYKSVADLSISKRRILARSLAADDERASEQFDLRLLHLKWANTHKVSCSSERELEASESEKLAVTFGFRQLEFTATAAAVAGKFIIYHCQANMIGACAAHAKPAGRS